MADAVISVGRQAGRLRSEDVRVIGPLVRFQPLHSSHARKSRFEGPPTSPLGSRYTTSRGNANSVGGELLITEPSATPCSLCRAADQRVSARL